ncbi:hypothetical protein AB0M29_42160 [Streptomyces sp. NPDC051976]|uniref:hypothetical protein n=1 Tax=Streptomyces sp. NPDC051976 TaxID=3154947 RepID=UPI0034158678
MTDDGRPAANLPDPQRTLIHTNWAGLQHAYGPATDAPDLLSALLHPDQSARTKALDGLHGTLHHQNTAYEATVPAAQYVAAILLDPRTTRAVDKDRRSFPGCLRAELLQWIGSVADTVDDEAEAIDRRHGLSLTAYPPAAALREIRPQLFAAAFSCTSDPDRDVREAAVAACIPLLDDPSLLHHRAAMVPRLREVLGISALWQYRERAIDALNAWGEDSSGIEGQQNPYEFCDADLSDHASFGHSLGHRSADGFSDDPPF